MQPAETSPLRFHKLRVAWSVGCVAGCILMILLCVRSYKWLDDISYLSSNAGPFLVQSNSGSICAGWYSKWGCPPGWTRRTLGHAPRPADFGAAISNAEVSFRWPYWFAIPAIAALATIPWARQYRWRFSLRTLLSATTALAALLGGLVAYDRAMVAADRVSIKETYMAGRISLDVARNYTDEDVDRWPKPRVNNPPPAH